MTGLSHGKRALRHAMMAGLLLGTVRVEAQAPFGASMHDRSRPIQVLTFTLARRTLSPPAVTVRPGQYQLRLRNGMFIGGTEFTLTADRGRGSATIPLSRKLSNTHAVFNLDAGRYELAVRGRPDLKATITVEP